MGDKLLFKVLIIVLVVGVGGVLFKRFQKAKIVEELDESKMELSVPQLTDGVPNKPATADTFTINISDDTPMAKPVAREKDIEIKFEDESIKEVERCFPNITPSSGQLILEDILNSNTGIQPTGLKYELDWENSHIKLQNGEERRIRISQSPSDNNHRFQIKLFKLDKEGLPVVVPIPPEDLRLPIKETYAKYLEKGKTVFRETKLSMFDPSQGISGNMVVENGQIRDINILQKGKNLNCQFNQTNGTTACICR